MFSYVYVFIHISVELTKIGLCNCIFFSLALSLLSFYPLESISPYFYPSSSFSDVDDKEGRIYHVVSLLLKG